ncbi:MAG: hypothetical protein ACM3JB_12575 [Acidobacteriaceae bacterium]
MTRYGLIFFAMLVLSVPALSQGSTGRGYRDPNYLVTRTLSETVISIDLQKNEVVLRDFDGKSHTVKVNKDTKFPDAGVRRIQDLRANQKIRLTYRVADAIAMEVRPAASPPR